jgi:hypothetical protein
MWRSVAAATEKPDLAQLSFSDSRHYVMDGKSGDTGDNRLMGKVNYFHDSSSTCRYKIIR